MYKINTLIGFRLRQAWRTLEEIGWMYMLIFLLVTIGFTFKGLAYLSEVDTYTMSLIACLLTTSVHASRKDRRFLEAMDIAKPLLYLGEYTLLLIPLILTLLLLGQYWPAAATLLGLLPVMVMPSGLLTQTDSTISLKLDFLPPQAIEFKSGLRRFFILLAAAYIIALVASPYVGTLGVLTFLLVVLIPSSFEYFEPKEMVASLYKEGNFLLEKVKINLLLYHLLLLPHYLLFLFFHWQYWYIALVCAVAMELVIAFSIVYKYSLYHPNREKMQSNTMSAVFLMTIITPGFVLISVLLLIRYWRKAQKNLAFYYA